MALFTGLEHSYYTDEIDYRGNKARGVTWKNFYNRYIEMGGDGFYSCVMIPYLEPSLKNKRFGTQHLKKGLCPEAEDLQQRLMAFKTNYRNIDIAQQKAGILTELIDEIGR